MDTNIVYIAIIMQIVNELMKTNYYSIKKILSNSIDIHFFFLQDFSSVRGYVWRDKFYGSVRTHKYILQVHKLGSHPFQHTTARFTEAKRSTQRNLESPFFLRGQPLI